MSRPFLLVLFLVPFTPFSSLIAQGFTFTKVADTSTAVPQGSGLFTAFSNMVSTDSSGDVAFSENNGGADDGIYLWSAGTITRIAGTDTAVPAGMGTFTGFSFFGNGLEGGRVAFRGNSAGAAGVYAHDGVTLMRLADTSTAIPDGMGSFSGFTTAYVDGTSYAFIAPGSMDQQGIYLHDGMSLSRIADKNSTVPDIGGVYGWSSQLGFDAGNIAFWANVAGGTQGGNIVGGYTPGGGLVTLATTATTAPGTAAAFTSFTSPVDLSGTTVVFNGSYAGGSGIYTTDLAEGGITRIASTTTAAPGGGGNFTGFQVVSIANGAVAFVGSTGSGTGVYLFQEGILRKVIATGNLLDGKTVTSLFISENSLAEGSLAFRAHFADSSKGIYVAEVGEPVVPPSSTKAAQLKKEIKKATAKLKLARKAGQVAKAKRFLAKLKKLKLQLRRL
ncbi:MAG: hypothetical protein KDN18_22385 [Verrucomicrobiae bacterium]|nr:hypothetical protein [Verrucomicrobiae bacterium]